MNSKNWFRRSSFAAVAAFTAVTALLPLVAVGCGEELDPAGRVTDFRLIAVRADKPYAAPGEQVQISTLFHEPFGRPITWAWATCVGPKDTTVNGCLAKVVEDARASGRSPFVSMGIDRSAFSTTVPANILDGLDPKVATSAFVGVVTVGCPGTIAVRELGTLKQGELPFRCIEAGSNQELSYDRFVVSAKRIYARRTERNENPSLTAVTFDGATWPEDEVKEVGACSNDPAVAFAQCENADKHEIGVVIPPEAAEKGTNEGGTVFDEDVVVQYYATEGLFEFEARTRESPKTTWTARAKSRGREQTFWFVARENRGGVTWTSRKVRVRE